MEFASEKIQNYIKWCVLELATNQGLANCNVYKEAGRPVCPLKNSIQAHGGSFDKGIAALADSIISDKELIELVTTLDDLKGSDDDNHDAIYDTETEILRKMIELTGLDQINSLHDCDMENFKDKCLLALDA